MSFTDIKSDHWIARLPARARPYAYLARLDRPIGIWLLLLPGWWAVMLAGGGVRALDVQGWTIFALFGIGAVVMRAAGCVVNDLWDRDLDAQVGRTSTRPLAAGGVTPKQALVFLAGLLGCGFLILIQMNMLTIALGVLSLPFIAVYPLMKRITWWPQAFLGLTFNFGALMGWSAVSGSIGAAALCLYVSGIFWTLGYDTVYAHQDKEDDALAGIKSTALKFGAQSKTYISLFYIMHIVLLGGALYFADFAGGGVFLLGGRGLTGFLLLLPAAAHLVWQVKSFKQDDPENALKIFKSNKVYGLLVLGAAMLGGF